MRALDSLDTAMRLQNPYMVQVKTPYFDSLRKDPRLQAIERALTFSGVRWRFFAA